VNIDRNSRLTTAIFKVRLGSPVAEVAAGLELEPEILQAAVDAYNRPSTELLGDMIAETMITIMASSPKGSDLTGLVNAFKIVSSGDTEDLFKKVEKHGEEYENAED